MTGTFDYGKETDDVTWYNKAGVSVPRTGKTPKPHQWLGEDLSIVAQQESREQQQRQQRAADSKKPENPESADAF